jgi:hypothetical protein
MGIVGVAPAFTGTGFSRDFPAPGGNFTQHVQSPINGLIVLLTKQDK